MNLQRLFTCILVLTTLLLSGYGTATAAPAPAPAADEVVQITISDSGFTPSELVIRAGTTVIWTNTSQRPHTATAGSALFDSGILQPGWSFEHTFERPTIVHYFSDGAGRDGHQLRGVIRIVSKASR